MTHDDGQFRRHTFSGRESRPVVRGRGHRLGRIGGCGIASPGAWRQRLRGRRLQLEASAMMSRAIGPAALEPPPPCSTITAIA